MAGNIVGPILALTMKDLMDKGQKAPDDLLETMGHMAVSQAIEILDAIDMRMPCGKCDECTAGIQCREIPA